MRLSITKKSDKIDKQWEAIKKIRNHLELDVCIVSLSDGWRVDADRDSVMRMQERIEMWSCGSETKTPDGRQMWKGADNDIRFFTETEFSAFVAEVREKRATKVDANFAFAEFMRGQLPVSDDHPAFTATNWPSP